MLIDNHGIKYGETNFRGTAIRMRVPSKKILNAQTIISQIATQGELELEMLLKTHLCHLKDLCLN